MVSNQKSFVYRKIPSKIKRIILTGDSVRMITGAMLLFFGAIFLLVFGSQVDFNANKIKENSPETNGIITKIETTNSSINDVKVMAYYYSYKTPDGVYYDGISYKAGDFKQINDEVLVKYARKTPEISVINGANTGVFSIDVLYFIVIIPLIGAYLVIINLISQIKILNLLKYGEISSGKMINEQFVKTFNTKANIYKYIFEFKAIDENIYLGSTKIKRRSFSDNQKLLYNPKNTSKILIIDSLQTNVKEYFVENYL